MTTTYNSIHFHRMLINDPSRCKAYRKAILKRVRPGDVVIDAGSGLGLLSFFACEAGASKVYAIERTDVIHVAKQIAKDNNLDKKILFIQDDALNLDLPESVDVIVSELISKAVFGQQMEAVITHLRDKYLKNDGFIIPELVNLWIAPVSCSEAVEPISSPEYTEYKIDFNYLEYLSKNHCYSYRFDEKHFIAPPQLAHTINLYESSLPFGADIDLTYHVNRPATFHGFAAWFSSALTDSVELNNKPPGKLAWDNAFFPVNEFVKLERDSTIKINLKVNEIGKRIVWRWNSKIYSNPISVARQADYEFSQNSFLGDIISPKTMKNHSK